MPTQVPKTAGKIFTGVHKALYRTSGGRVGGKLMIDDKEKGQIVILTTTGRKSGRKRSTPLIAVDHPMGWVITASNSGHHHAPDWYHNLRAEPTATLQVGSESHTVRSREMNGEERDQLWNELVHAYNDYTTYQEVTEREIPVLVLERIAS